MVSGPQGFSPPAEGIALTAYFFPTTYMLAFFKPTILIDGYQVPGAGWRRRTLLPARPGRHRVHVHVPYWFSHIGHAETVIDVYPGQWAELEYKAPAFAFGTGSLGTPPQRYNNVGMMIVLIAFIVAFFIGIPLMALAIYPLLP